MAKQSGRLIQNQQYRQLWSEVDHLGDLVDAAAGLKLPDDVRRAFAAYDKSCEAGEGCPSRLTLDSARDAFYAMPAALQREVLNGWEPAADLRERADVAKMDSDDPVSRVLRLSVCQGKNRPLRISGCLRDELHQSSTSVLIFVAHGTPKPVALEALQMAATTLDCAWPRAMRGDYIEGELVHHIEKDGSRKSAVAVSLDSPLNTLKQKSGVPVSLNAPKLGSKGERAKETAAA